MQKTGARVARFSIFFAVVLAMMTTGCGMRSGAGANPLESNQAVKLIEDVPYWDGKSFDEDRHILDLYIPRGLRNYPVVFFVHGGAWIGGDKAITSMFGMTLARHGVGVVSINYRLWPQVGYPWFVKDVARAFAWTVDHIEEYGGDPGAIFVGGHSAGAHLTSLIAANGKFLADQDLSPKDIRGVIALAGVYRLGDEQILKNVFGGRSSRDEASPYYYANASAPPFLIFYADGDLQGLDDQAERFGDELDKKGVPVEVMRVSGRNHNTLLGWVGRPNDPALPKILSFVKRYR